MRAINREEKRIFNLMRLRIKNMALVSTELDGIETAVICDVGLDEATKEILMFPKAVLVNDEILKKLKQP